MVKFKRLSAVIVGIGMLCCALFAYAQVDMEGVVRIESPREMPNADKTTSNIKAASLSLTSASLAAQAAILSPQAGYALEIIARTGVPLKNFTPVKFGRGPLRSIIPIAWPLLPDKRLICRGG